MPTVDYDDDMAVSDWIEQNHSKLQKRIEELKHESARQNLVNILREDPKSSVSVIKDFLSNLPEDQRSEFAASLK